MNKMKQLREDNEYTQKQFAEILDVTLNTVQKWEQGTRFPGRRSKKDIEKTFPELTIEEVDNLFNEEVL